MAGIKAGTVFIAVKGDLTPLDKALKSAWDTADKRTKQISKFFDKMEARIKKSWRSISTGIKDAIIGWSLGEIITETLKLADKYTLLESRIKLVTTSSGNFEKVQGALFQISQRTRVGYESTVEIFTRLARATKNTSITQADMLKVTESLNKAVIVSGATSIEASNALIQLSQGLAANRLGGEELRSVMEQIPRVGQMIADGLEVDIGKFREMSKAGELTAEVVTKALLKQSSTIDEEFSKMPLTIGQAWTKITNTVGKAINETNKYTGATSSLASILDYLNGILEVVADNTEVVISGFITLAKIAAAGGALWALPIVIAKIHKGLVLLNLTLFKVQGGVIGLNTALFGTSVNAQLAAGSLSKMKLAGSALMALFVGWELGKWANDNFEEVRIAGLATIAGLNESWINFKFAFLQLWTDMKFGAIGIFDDIKTSIADVIDDIAEKMSGMSVTIKNPFGDDFTVGLDAASKKFNEVAGSMRDSSTAAKEHAAASADLAKEKEKAIGIHTRTVEILIEQRDWEKKVSDQDTDKTETIIKNNDRIVSSTSSTNDARKNSEQELNSKINELTSNQFDHKLYLLKLEKDKYEKANADKNLIDQWYDKETKKIYEERMDAITEAQNEMYEDLGELDGNYYEFHKKELDKRRKDYEKLGVDKNLIDRWYDKELRDIEINSSEWRKNLHEMTTEFLKGANEEFVGAFIRGENAKEAVAKLAVDKLSGFATKSVEKGLPKMLEALGQAVGGWIGFGVSETATEGDTWQEKLATGAGYLAGAAAAIMAGKAVGNNFAGGGMVGYAEGGWLSQHLDGGIIRGGTGFKDDVFLGFTGGGNIANWGMANEYVMPKAQTAKYLPQLEKMRNNTFEAGGPIRDPMEAAKEMNNNGFDVFGTEIVNSGNWKRAIAVSVAWYVGSALAMMGGKEFGANLFADGGTYDIEGFKTDGDAGKEITWDTGDTDAITTTSTDPIINKYVDLINDQIKQVNESDFAGGGLEIIDLLPFDDLWAWLRDRGGRIQEIIEDADRVLAIFLEDVFTPGKSVTSATFEEMIGQAYEQIVEELQDILVNTLDPLGIMDDPLNPLDPFDLFHDGTSFVPKTGPAVIERGERIFSKGDNEEIMEILRNGGGEGGTVVIESNPQIKIMIGGKEIKNFILDVTDDYNTKKSRRGVTGRTRFAPAT